MNIKDSKKLARQMTILCLVIGMVALAVGIVAVGMKSYLIAGAMGIVTVGQIFNFCKWKKMAR